MNLKELMSTSVDDLRQKQHDALKKHIIDKLNAVIKDITDDKSLDYIEKKHISYSPAGDCMGCEDHFINFSYDESEDSTKNIYDILRELSDLKGNTVTII